MHEFTHSLMVNAPPAAVLDAFFDADSLAAWWNVRRSFCVARPLGVFAVEWDPTEWKDEILGRLGGALRGTVVEFEAGREFFIADLFWLPPDGDPVGPMALEATCSQLGEATVLHVRQSGWEDSPRWSRYYELVTAGFAPALDELKQLVERRWSR